MKGDGEAKRAALANGLTRYRNGYDCKNGHKNPERLTSCGRCVLCHRHTKKKAKEFRKFCKEVRIKYFGFDPKDLRFRRKERKLALSDRPSLVRLREKRREYGRADRPNGLSQAQPRSS